jgi:hypothetical protein
LQDRLLTDNFNEGGEGIRGGGARLFFLQAMSEVPDT